MLPLMALSPMNSFELWQREWGEYLENKFEKILPKLTDRLPSRCLTRREETALSRLHIGHSHVTGLFLLKGEGLLFLVCFDEPLSLEHILLLFSDLIDIRRKYCNVNTLKVLFKEVSSDIIFNLLKEINISYKL